MHSEQRIILADLLSSLDNATISILEKWVQGMTLGTRKDTSRGRGTSADSTACVHGEGDDKVGSVIPAESPAGHQLEGSVEAKVRSQCSSPELKEAVEANKAAVVIQSQVRRNTQKHLRLIVEAGLRPQWRYPTPMPGIFSGCLPSASG